MNVWYEARLVEEGIEEVQNLATSDIGNALLRTRIPPERLINWIDQALLRMHVPCRRTTWQQTIARPDGSGSTSDRPPRRARLPGPGSNGKTFPSGIEELLNTDADRRERPARASRARSRSPPGRAEPQAHPRLALLLTRARPEGAEASEARAGRARSTGENGSAGHASAARPRLTASPARLQTSRGAAR